MRRAAIVLCAVLLAGCSSFKLGGFVYCPHGGTCTFQQISIQVVPAPAA
jgi:outer membrane murein-binding lipoprotein Lpp